MNCTCTDSPAAGSGSPPPAELASPGLRGRHTPPGIFPCAEVLFVLAVCLLDTTSSAYFFQSNLAVEANPVLAPAAAAGILPFVAAKSLSFVPALVVAEWYRRRRPDLILPLLRWVGLLYVGIYLLTVAGQFLG